MASPAKTVKTPIRKSFSIEELCVSFISRNRFYACLLSKMNKVEESRIETAGVGFSAQGKIVLYYNPAYFLRWNLGESQALIEHEVLHVFLNHLTRLPKVGFGPGSEWDELKNVACDMAIDQYLPGVPDAILPEKFDLPKEMSAEFYFEALKQKAQGKGKGKGGKGGQPGDGQPDDSDGEGKSDKKGTHSLWGKTIDDKGNIKDVSESEACDIQHELEKIVRQAIKETDDQAIGQLPAGIRRELELLKNPVKKHDWKKELKVFINSVLTVAKRLSQKRVNKRFLETVDYLLPGKKKDRKPSLMLARDTSGSVFNDEMQDAFLNEMINISKFCHVFVADCDTVLHQVYEVKRKEDFKHYEGGGGTYFEPVFVAAKEYGVDGVIYLTDTQGSFPNKEDIGKFASKTIWVTVNQKSVNVPFGKHVNIQDT